MFFGKYECTIDDKGRLMIPSKLRVLIDSKLYLVKGFDGCISAYKEEDFQTFIKRLQNLEVEKGKVRLYQRMILSSIEEVTLDKTGRILIPQKILKDYISGKNVTLVGDINHIEIWDQSKWNDYMSENEKDFEKCAELILENEE